jgi:hypothetical protein
MGSKESGCDRKMQSISEAMRKGGVTAEEILQRAKSRLEDIGITLNGGIEAAYAGVPSGWRGKPTNADSELFDTAQKIARGRSPTDGNRVLAEAGDGSGGRTGTVGAEGAGEKELFRNPDGTMEFSGTRSKAGKFIDNTTDKITQAERQVVDDLVAQGKTVERIPKDSNNPTPDFKVDGVKTELKTLKNPNTNTGVTRIQDGFEQGAETVMIDARNTGLTATQAQEIIDRAAGTYTNKIIPGKVEIWIEGQVIIYP